MENIEKLLKKIENNFHIKDKKEVEQYTIGNETYEVLLPSRSERADILFSKKVGTGNSLKDFYEWLKPHIYRMFQLKDLAVKAKEAGYIQTHYEVMDMLFSADEISEIISYVMQKVNPSEYLKSEVEFEKKQ